MTKAVRTAFAILAAGTVLAAAIPASATPLHRTVYCNDGSVFKKVGDQVTDAQVCANHGGVLPKHQRVPGGGIKADAGTIPAIPNRTPKPKVQVKR